MQLLFPEGLSQAHYFANTSFKEDTFYITVRPVVDGPRLEEAFPPGLTVYVHGNPSPVRAPSPVVIVNGIVPTARAQARPFEQQRTVITYTTKENVYPARRRQQNLLSPEFLVGLPPISIQTSRKLQDWRGYLSWKQRMIESGLAGLRYLAVEVTDDGRLRFLVVSESQEAFEKFQKCLRRQELMAFGSGYSKNEWIFEYNDKYRDRAVRIGLHPHAVFVHDPPVETYLDRSAARSELRYLASVDRFFHHSGQFCQKVFTPAGQPIFIELVYAGHP